MGLVQFGLTWLVIGSMVKVYHTYTLPSESNTSIVNRTTIPIHSPDQTSFSLSANSNQSNELKSSVLNISDDERRQFHPVVIFPQKKIKVHHSIDETGEKGKKKAKVQWKQVPDYHVLDLSNIKGAEDAYNLAATQQQPCNLVSKVFGICKQQPKYAVGKYNEERLGLYTSELFQNTSNSVDGYNGQRTIHIGVDLFGPVGQKVFAFADGKVHSFGYNAEDGDYGYVVVLEHTLHLAPSYEETVTVWALYGHLSANSIKGKKVGKVIKKGKVVGQFGDMKENGGWSNPHVHFQLSMHPPETHDMPGVVSRVSRERALLQYPDPQLVLGTLY